MKFRLIGASDIGVSEIHYKDPVSNFDHIRPFVANDNSPTAKSPRGDAVGFNAMLRERQKQRQELAFHSAFEEFTQKNNIGFWLSALIWSGFGAGVLWAFYTSQPMGTRVFAAIGLIWSGLWTRFLALDHDNPRLAETAILSSLLGFIALLVTATLQMGFPLSLPAGLLVFIGVSLIVSFINNSVTALICAIACSLFWAAMQIEGYMVPGIYSLAIPAVLSLTILQAIRLKSGLSIFVAAVIGYIWLTGTAFIAFNAEQISALFLASGAAVVGNAHLRSAKAAEDEGTAFTQWQVAFAWMVANGALLILAKYGLDPFDPIWTGTQNTNPALRLAWLIVVSVSLMIYFIANIIRTRHEHMSVTGVMLTTFLLAMLPMAIWNINSLAVYFTSVTNLPFYPNAGLFLYGIVTGNIMFFISNAFRRHHYGKVVVALIAIAALAYIASGIDLIYQENWVIWLAGTLASIIVALIAVEPQLLEQDDGLRNSVSSS